MSTVLSQILFRVFQALQNHTLFKPEKYESLAKYHDTHLSSWYTNTELIGMMIRIFILILAKIMNDPLLPNTSIDQRGTVFCMSK
jgi:hypothetical protein